MKIATINLPKIHLDALDALVDAGYYPNRSEAIRVALRKFLDGTGRELEALQEVIS